MPKRTSSTSGSPERDKAKVECSTLLTRGLRALQAEYPQVGDVPGPGLFIGVELVKDPATREPAPAEARRIVDEAWKRG